MKIMNNKFLLMCSLCVMIAIGSCKHDPFVNELVQSNPKDSVNNGGNNNGGNNNNNNNNNVVCDPNVVYFQQQVLPLFISNCAMGGCHDAASHQDGVVLDNYANIINTGDIEAGNLSAGKVYEVITETDPDKIMPRPPAAPLNSAQIALIANWIQQGAQNNSCANSVCDTSVVKFSTSVSPIIDNKCKGCHSGSAPSGSIDLSTYSGVSTIALNGKLEGVVNHISGYSAMPKNGAKLSTCELAKIRIWVDAGAPNN